MKTKEQLYRPFFQYSSFLFSKRNLIGRALLWGGMIVVCTWACEEEITPIGSDDPPEIVVEGFIEGGELPTPPVVIITKSIPFSRIVGDGRLSSLFVHDAEVQVSNGSQTVQLSEFCWDDLEEDQKRSILENFNLGFDSLAVNVCVYTDPNINFLGEIGQTYDLEILAEGKRLTAQTTIPPHVPIDSLFFKPNTAPFWELLGFIEDVDSLASFYRYFTSINQAPFISPVTSVSDDLFFNGQSFEFPLNKAERGGSVPIQEYGLYYAGDTVGVKWTTIDEVHFNFWSTLEFNSFNQGPFGSYTRVESNIDGGLGIWGGYANSYYFIIVPQ
ncbi:MAG: DUF4249 domain-containing protein [Bacteroidota bacterium]